MSITNSTPALSTFTCDRPDGGFVSPKKFVGVTTVAADGTTTTTMQPPEEQERDFIASLMVHGAQAYAQAGDAIRTMTLELDKVQQSVSALRPNIKSSDWDFKLKDGKLIVSGDKLSKADAKLIESQLNGDKAMVGAVKSFVGSAVLNLEISDDNPEGTTLNLFTGATQQATFNNVAAQIDGKLDFKRFLAHNNDLATDHGSLTLDCGNLGYSAMNVLGSMMKSTEPVGYQVFPTAGNVKT